jgi:hypothetical protein
MLEKSQLIMWEVTSVRQYWSAPAAIRVMANETNNATVTGLITLAKGCFMFHGPVRVVDHVVAGMTGPTMIPWCVLPGLRCGPAQSNEGGSHLPTA